MIRLKYLLVYLSLLVGVFSFAQVGTLTGTGMSICNLYSFSVCPNQIITPYNYGNQGYACTGASMPDVSFNINGPVWRVMKYNWIFSATTSGQVKGYDASGNLQSFPFIATNTISPLSYSGNYVQFAVNGVATGTLLNQATFSISLNPVVFGSNTFTYCPASAPNVTIAPILPAQGGPWTYTWMPGNLYGNPVSVSPTVSTVYTLTSTSSIGCTSQATVSVDVNCLGVPTATFIAPDTVCVNQQFNVLNQSVGATTYYWNFCQGNTNTTAQAINLGNVGSFSGPVFITIAKEGTNYYAFVSNNSTGTITRLFFGSSLLNNPTFLNLGNFGGALPGNLEDIHIENENGVWYGIVVGGMFGNERIVRLNFGNSLANTPTAQNMGNIGAMNYPQRIKIFKNGSNYFGFVTNRDGNTITRFSFGSSLANTPTGQNLGNIGNLNIPDALGIININNAWYGYVINEGNNTITRLNFGNSLLNTPIGVNVGNTGFLNGPRAIDMWVECGQIKGLITNRFGNDLLNMNFPSGPTGTITTTSYGNIANFSFPHSITRFRSGDTLYAFITNVSNNTLSRVFFTNCTNSSIQSTTLSAPPTISYNQPGNYYISLVTNEGQITQSSYCKQITVINTPTLVVSSSPTICLGASTTLSVSGAVSYTWSTGSQGNSITVNPSVTTQYSVTGLLGGCSNQKTTTVNVVPASTVAITGNTVICAGQTTTLSVNDTNNYLWSNSITSSSIIVNPLVTTSYSATSLTNSCVNTAPITVTVNPLPNIIVSGNINLCAGESTVLNASGADTYLWSNGVNSSSISVSPTSSTTYSLTGVLASCTNTQIVTVNVNTPPTITQVNITNADCGINNGGINVSVISAAASYLWSNGNTGNNISGLSSGVYSLAITNNGCVTHTVFLVSSNNSPVITSVLFNNTSCGLSNGTATVNTNASNYSYNWNSAPLTNENTQDSLAPGSYTVIVSNGSCQTQTVITILASQPLVINSSSISPSDCNVPNGEILVSDNYSASSYSWSPNTGINSGTLTAISAGIYSLTITNGVCQTFSVFNVPQKNPPTSFTTFQTAATCKSADGTVRILKINNGHPPYRVNFDNAGFSNIFQYNNLQAGIYSIIVKDTMDCIYMDSVIVEEKKVPAILNFNVELPDCEGTNGELVVNEINGGKAPYLLNFNSLGYSENKTYNNLEPGNYLLTVLDSNRCETNFLIPVSENKDDYTIYAPNSFTPNNDKINDVWYVQGVCIKQFHCTIYNRWGQKIKELNDISEGWDGLDAPNDIYVYKLEVKTKYNVKVHKTGHITLLK